jgi:hypothetical protein
VGKIDTVERDVLPIHCLHFKPGVGHAQVARLARRATKP